MTTIHRRLRRGPASAMRLFHTVRHLKPVQIYGRFWFRLSRPRPDFHPAAPLRKKAGPWQQPIEPPAKMEGPSKFCFLNRRDELRAPADWNAADQDKLWLYNLHYFDDLNAAGAGARVGWHRDLIGRWITENPPGHGNGWEPYPLSLRIVNWIKWALAGNGLAPKWRQSLAVQTRVLHQRIEWHLLGNHLLANAKALVFAGLFFEGDEAEAWRARGLDILKTQLDEQILADGGHFELSPMYHAIILEDILDLINLAQGFPGAISTATPGKWAGFAQRMQRWQTSMIHPDNRIAFFNDAAFAIAADPVQIEDYGNRLQIWAAPAPGKCPASPVQGAARRSAHPSPQTLSSGYAHLRKKDAVLIADVAPIGPDYLPGHAHADTLSFELSLFGRRVLVNSGTSLYGSGKERQHQRSTAAHNTVEVDGENSSEVWGGFRVARRARVFDVEIADDEDQTLVRAAHDGYRRLAGRVIHHRQWRLGDGGLTITDYLEGRFDRAIARFHLHPHVQADINTDGTNSGGRLILSGPQARKIAWRVEGGKAHLRHTFWHPEFGLEIPNICLEIVFSKSRCILHFDWS